MYNCPITLHFSYKTNIYFGKKPTEGIIGLNIYNIPRVKYEGW